MSDIASAQLRRILALLPELANEGMHPIEPLAARLGSDRETLLGDLRALADRFDDPGGFAEQGVALFIEGERVSLSSPHFRRPMRLTSAELAALELGLAMLEGERPPEEHRTIARARAQLRAAMTRLAAEGREVTRVATLASGADARRLHTMREAIRLSRKLRIGYRRADAELPTDRVVRPYAIAVSSGHWYAVAFCERVDAVRVFRLDRVEQAELLAEPYTVPDGFSVDSLIREGRMLLVDHAAPMRVRYSPRIARWIAEREGAELDADGSLTLEHPLADVQWAVRHVLQYGPDAEVLEPADTRQAVRDALVAMASATAVSRPERGA
jgi:proteasome accessory factor C